MPEHIPPDQSAYRVLARKYRPSSFADLIGQEPMVRTLSNAFRKGRIAQAYMLTGVRGVGKTTTARILARALNYKNGDIDAPHIGLESEGEHCRAIMEGRHVDVIEMDAASHTGIDDIRDIIEAVQYAPAIARYKVYIIDEVHMLSRNAFNGLLKTLEEPPAHLKFIFATTEIRRVPVTVLSRCQRFDLRRIDTRVMVSHLIKVLEAEGVEAEDEALAMIARASEGSVRDALSMLDQAIAHSDGRVEAAGTRAMLGLADRARIIDLFAHVMGGEIGLALAELKDQYDTGADPHVVLTDLADFIHYVTRLKYAGDGENAPGETGLSETERRRGREFAAGLSVRVLARAWQILVRGLEEVAGSERPLAAADMVLIRLTHAADLPGHEELVKAASTASSSASPSASPSQGASPVPADQGGGGAGTRASALAAPVQPSAGGLHAGGRLQASHAKPGPAGEPAAASAQARQADPVADPAASGPLAVVNRFEELVFLAEDRRDLKAKSYLRQHVGLIECRTGYLEFNQVGNPPRDALQYLKGRVEAWTGQRWDFVVSARQGLPTIEAVERHEHSERIEKARNHPAVEAILRTFEGARIVDVRIREEEALPSPSLPGEEEGGEGAIGETGEDGGLDDFFN